MQDRMSLLLNEHTEEYITLNKSPISTKKPHFLTDDFKSPMTYPCVSKILFIVVFFGVSHFYYLSALVGCWSSVFIRRIIYNFLNVCFPFDYTAIAVSVKVERSQAGLTIPVGWLLFLQLTVLSRSAIVV